MITRVQALSTQELLTLTRTTSQTDKRIGLTEWHKRLSLPFASLTLALIAIAIGTHLQKPRSKAIGALLGLLLATLYYLCLITGQHLSLSGLIPPWVGAWAPNGIAVTIAAILLRLKTKLKFRAISQQHSPIAAVDYQRPQLPSLINHLLISEALRISTLSTFALLTTTLLFTLLDLLPAINHNTPPLGQVTAYLLFLTPQILYIITPFAILIGTVTAYFTLARSNQLTSLSACGVSPLRVALPIVLLASTTAVLLFIISNAILPHTTREQDRYYQQIKGKRIEQATIALGRNWAYGSLNHIFGFHYSAIDKQLLNTYIYKLHSQTSLLESAAFISKAKQSKNTNTLWLVESGWRISLNQASPNALPIEIQSSTSLELFENEQIFSRTTNESAKLSFRQLRNYVEELRRAGIPHQLEQIHLWRRISHPFSCLTLILLAIPLTVLHHAHSRRETLAGIGIGMTLGILYWLLTQGFEVAGMQGLLPVWIATWGNHFTYWAIAIYLWGQRFH